MHRVHAAAESRSARLVLFTTLYFVQGIPSGFFLISLPGWFAQNGLSKGEIGGFIAIVTMPWAFKFVFAPIMDRVGFLKMGRRRPWIIATQLGIFACTLWMAFVPDPLHHLRLLSLCGFLVNLFSSIQDLAVDGMSVDLVPEHEQARVQAFMIGGQALGKTAATAGGALVLIAWGYAPFVVLTAIAAAIGMLFPLLIRERAGESLLPWTPGQASPEALKLQIGDWTTLLRELFGAFRVRASLIVVTALFIHRLPVGITRTVYPVVTVQKLGWSNGDYSNLLGFATLASAILAMCFGPWIVRRMGRLNAIHATFGAVVLLFLASGFFTALWPHRWFMSSSAILAEILVILSNVAFYAMCMQLCRKRVAATQFALYMALNNLGVTAGAWLTGRLERYLSEPQFFYLSAALSALVMVVLLAPRLGAEVEAADGGVQVADDRRQTTEGGPQTPNPKL
ncbi:MAG TPA: MFS transporter [Opitutaceae bacterium]|nr:MFS transporter [Opitutaceae bacterium]